MNSLSCNYPLPTSQPLRGAALGTCSSKIHGSFSLIGFDELRYFASGTGAAGIVGAFLWWEIRSLEVRLAVGLSSVGTLQHIVALC